MEWKWNYGQGVTVLPTAVLETDASLEQLRVLLWLASDATLFTKPAQLAKLAGCEREEIAEILDFWRSAGVLSNGQEPARAAKRSISVAKKREAPAKEPARAAAVLARADELPNYSTQELADLLEESQELRMLMGEAQGVWGKVFNPYEAQLVVGMSRYMGLDSEYILLLLAHCKRIRKNSLRAVERYAIRLVDDGITNSAALEEFIKKTESRLPLQGKVRSMFGIGEREFTSDELGMFNEWVSYGYGEDIIRCAYEITVNATQKPSIPYANSILKRWHDEGLASLAQINAKLDKEREKKGKAPAFGSFETNDFYEAALNRSFYNGQNDDKT